MSTKKGYITTRVITRTFKSSSYHHQSSATNQTRSIQELGKAPDDKGTEGN